MQNIDYPVPDGKEGISCGRAVLADLIDKDVAAMLCVSAKRDGLATFWNNACYEKCGQADSNEKKRALLPISTSHGYYPSTQPLLWRKITK
jgi:hypothetical protein